MIVNFLGKITNFFRQRTPEEITFYFLLPAVTVLTFLFTDYELERLDPFMASESVLILCATFMVITLSYLIGFRFRNFIQHIIKNEKNIKKYMAEKKWNMKIPCVRNWFFSIVAIIFCSFFFSAVTDAVFTGTQPTQVISGSKSLLAFDQNIFGINSPFWLLKSIPDSLLNVLVLAYISLIPVFYIAYSIFLLKDINALRQLVLSSIFAFCIGLPFWIFVPAVSPHEILYQNIFDINIADQYSFDPSADSRLSNFLEHMANMWSRPAADYFAVSTLPSMHVAWAYIVTVTTKRWRPWTAKYAVPWFLLVMVSTVSTLQHYAVDALLGLIVGMVSLQLFEILNQLSKEDYHKHYRLLKRTQNSYRRMKAKIFQQISI